MSKFLHRRKNARPADDIETNAASGDQLGDPPPPEPLNLGEYPALDRYISTYREESGQKYEDNTQEKRPKPRWWQFWKSSGENAQGSPDPATEVPDVWLKTDINSGISESTVDERRKRFGWNELTTEKENMFYKLITYFMGPILYGKPCL
jgi:H+-transporting ATPase